MSLPEQATKTYVANLLLKGKNDTFEIDRVEQQVQVIDGDAVGFHFEAVVKLTSDFGTKKGYGATPRQAVQRALSKHGVQFI